MFNLTSLRHFSLLILTAWFTLSWSGMPVSAEEIPEFNTAAEALEYGKSKERSSLWLDAIDGYEEALDKWPGNKDLEYHLRVSKINFGIERRYEDDSFENQLLVQSRNSSLALYDDIFRQVQLNYVDRLSPTSFFAHGTESLYYALSNQKFLSENLSGVDQDQVKSFKNTLFKQYWNKPVGDSYSAQQNLNQICDQARSQLGLAHGPVVMEFLFGGCNALDDYSNFLTANKLEDLYGNIEGEFVGLGIEMKGEPGKGLLLVDVLPNSPAERGGLAPEEYIVAIDGENCREMNTDEGARKLRGPSGSQVTLQVYDDLTGQTRTALITRKAVQIFSVTIADIIDENNKIGYIKMTGFQKNTAREMREALAKLNSKGMRSLIWDLRGNPGGLLDAAVDVLDMFIDRGVLVSTKGRVAGQNQVYTAHSGNTYHIPLVLLVDGNSASASEIVAGAIRDHKRGQIIGRKTYGKWSVQSIFPIRHNTGLRITTAKFYSPNNLNHSKVGVKPMIEVEENGNTLVTSYRGNFHKKYRLDPDISRGMDELKNRLSQLNRTR